MMATLSLDMLGRRAQKKKMIRTFDAMETACSRGEAAHHPPATTRLKLRRGDALPSDLGVGDSMQRFIDAQGCCSAGSHQISQERSAYLAVFGALKLWGVLQNPTPDGPPSP